MRSQPGTKMFILEAILLYPLQDFKLALNSFTFPAIAVNPKNNELDDATYQAAHVYIDNWNNAKTELGLITKLGVEFKGQIGDLITGAVPPPSPDTITVFQSLGMAVEDCAMARLIYDLHVASNL